MQSRLFVSVPNRVETAADLRAFSFSSRGVGQEDAPVVAPTKPEVKPDIEKEPNTVPSTPVPEPAKVPCPRPDTSCPVE